MRVHACTADTALLTGFPVLCPLAFIVEVCTWMPRVIAFSTQAHTALWRHQHRSHRTVAVRSPRTAAHSVLQTRVCINCVSTRVPGTPLQRISRADDERSWQCLRPFGGSVWSRLEQRLAAHRSASASDALPSDAPTSAGNATCATVVAPSTTSTGRAATSLRRTCPSCAWPLQRGPHHPADPLLVPGGLLCRGVKWTRGVRRRRGPGGGVQILAPARSQIHRPCVLSPPAVHVQSPVSRSTGAPTPDAAAAPAAVCWSTPAGWFEGGKIASG